VRQYRHGLAPLLARPVHRHDRTPRRQVNGEPGGRGHLDDGHRPPGREGRSAICSRVRSRRWNHSRACRLVRRGRVRRGGPDGRRVARLVCRRVAGLVLEQVGAVVADLVRAARGGDQAPKAGLSAPCPGCRARPRRAQHSPTRDGDGAALPCSPSPAVAGLPVAWAEAWLLALPALRLEGKAPLLAASASAAAGGSHRDRHGRLDRQQRPMRSSTWSISPGVVERSRRSVQDSG
jgi:hypothetical protein